MTLTCVDCGKLKKSATGQRCLSCVGLTRRRDWTAIVAAYSDGKSLRKVGGEFGLSPERVRQILAKSGCKARHQAKSPSVAAEQEVRIARKAARCAQRDKVIGLWRGGLTCAGISAETGLSLCRVRYLVERHGNRRHRKPPKASQAILTIDKAFKATRLRSEGKTKSEVARALGVPRNSVGRLYKLGDEARGST